jgi:hypothetical protein
MLSITLNDKTAKLLESYRRAQHMSREQALEKLLEEATERQSLQNALSLNWSRQDDLMDATFEADVNELINNDRAKQRSLDTR